MKVVFENTRIALVLGVLGAFAFADGAAAQAPTPSAGPPALVHIRASAFKPATITVGAGDAIEFINDDTEAHTVTADDASFDSGYLATGDHWRHTFLLAGRYHYACTYHPTLKGTVVVRAR